MRSTLLGLTLPFASCFFLAQGCQSSSDGSVELVTGLETDVFTRAPAPTTLRVDAVNESGQKSQIYSGPVGGTLDLGSHDRSAFARLEVAGTDDSGVVRMRGGSLFFQYGALQGTGLKLFVQRTGELARLPDPLLDGRSDPIVDIVRSRLILIAGGGVKDTQLYDLLNLKAVPNPPVLGLTPRSLVVFDVHAVAIDDTGASDVDVTTGATRAITPPIDGAFAEVAGGQTVYAHDGTAFVIGATRLTGAPTARILRVATDATLSFVSLSTPRLGATAAWMEGRGVVVIGGSTTGAGAELLAVDGKTATAIPVPVDTLPTGAAVQLDGGRVLVVPEPRVIDIGCAPTCPVEAWPKLPMPLKGAHVYTTPGLSGGAVVVGNDPLGLTRLFILHKDSPVEERPLKIPRKGAGSLAMPTGGVGIVAGGSGNVEAFVP